MHFKTLKQRAEFDEAVEIVSKAFETAKSRAVAGVGTKNHGVEIVGDTVTVFEEDGESNTVTLPSSVSASTTKVIFKRLSGGVDEATSTNLQHNYDEDADASVTVNEAGAVIIND